jgi:hypothetical protein
MSGHKRHRALVTIEFFKLDDEAKRKNLFRERALVIVALLPQLENAKGSGPAADKARKLVNAHAADNAPHATVVNQDTSATINGGTSSASPTFIPSSFW